MKETLVILLIIIFYVFASYKIYSLLIKLKIFYFILVGISYIFLTYLFFDGAVHLDNHLRDLGIYFEFGHASMWLVLTFLLCSLIAISTIMIAIQKKPKNKFKDKSTE